jgi:hypothetical protein
MLTRLLQAAAITGSVYLIMICRQLPAQQTVLLVDFQRPAVARLGSLLAEVIELILDPVRKDA